MSSADRPGDLERYAVDCALYAARWTHFWTPSDPDYGFLEYFEAAVTRNLGLLWGFETLAEDMDRRGIVPPTEGEQATLVTDGGRSECPDCGHELDTEENNDALAADEHHEYFCPRCGRLFEDEPALTDGGEVPLPTDEIVTPTLDAWEHRGGGWHTWIDDDQKFRVHIEMVTLEVPEEQAALNAFEVRLDDLRDGRPYPVVVRETLRTDRLAVAVAELLASEPERYADEWGEVAPRPEEVGRLDE
jgi:hypothetical protein